jgi:Cu2+-containing amine oxidase
VSGEEDAALAGIVLSGAGAREQGPASSRSAAPVGSLRRAAAAPLVGSEGHEGREVTVVMGDEFRASKGTSWRIYNRSIANADGRLIGYELVPEIGGVLYGMYDTTEPWSRGELWVTRQDPCELLAIANHTPLIPDACSGSPDNLSEMVAEGADIDGQDVVVWYANRFHHYIRDEDDPLMPIEWIGFKIEPRGFHHQNPGVP